MVIITIWYNQENKRKGAAVTMQSDTFEKAFSNYLEHKDYDEAEDALFSIIRAAFLAGWHAAGG